MAFGQPGRDAGPNSKGKSENLLDVGVLSFKQVPVTDNDEDSFMGCTQRSSITGEITVNAENTWPHFHVVDIFCRDVLYGTLRHYLEDDYVFLPVALPNRTWTYHHYYLEKKVSTSGSPEFAMVKDALETRCVDADVRVGQWSPIMVYAPVVMMLTLGSDMLALLAGLFLVLCIWFLSMHCNCPAWFMFTRPFTLLPRLGFAGFLGYRFAEQNSFSQFIFVIVLVATAADVIFGDFLLAWNYGFICSYNIVKALPERVFVCERHGAYHLDDVFGERLKVSSAVTGIPGWKREYHLIADIGGMLAELRPMRVQDVKNILDEGCHVSETMSFVSLNSYSLARPIFQAIGAKPDKREAVSRAFVRDLPDICLLRNDKFTLFASSVSTDFWDQPEQPRTPIGNAPSKLVVTDL